MDELLSAENLEWRAKAREIADKVVRPKAAHYDRIQEYPWEIRDALAEAGLMGVWIPKEYGGAGAGVLNLCIVVEELSRACGGVGVLYAVNALGSFPILLAGTHGEIEQALARAGLPARPSNLAGQGSAQVWTVPGQPFRLAVISGQDAAAVNALQRGLPHYGGQSWLVFEQGRAINRGVWPVSIPESAVSQSVRKDAK